jgi:methionine--tRNA ligase beta chain
MTISLEDFSKIDIRVARIIAVERIEGSEKLLRIELEFDDQWRQVVAGIGKNYSPDDLLGKEVVFVANLKSKLIKGIESQGMILAAISPDGPVILVPEREVPPGSKVS